MHTLTLAELARKLRARELSVTELTKSLLTRIEAAQPQLNAFITVMADSAMAQSVRAEAALKDGSAGPMHRRRQSYVRWSEARRCPRRG